jgi:hypothetical protein
LLFFSKRQTTVTNGGQTVTISDGSSSGDSGTGSQTSGKSSGLSQEAKVALGLGIGLGIPTLIVTIWGACWGPATYRRWRQRHRQQSAKSKTPDDTFSSKQVVSDLQKPEEVRGGPSWGYREPNNRSGGSPTLYHKPELDGSSLGRNRNRQFTHSRTTQDLYELPGMR